MQAEPDGVEVVEARSDAAALTAPPLLIIDALRDHLDSRGLGAGDLEWQRIGEGHSNVTYLIRRTDAAMVLRRGPRPPHPPSTHNMVREARILSTLAGAGAPVPEVIDVCTDESVLGVPFYVMQFIDGVVITGAEPAGFESSAARRQTSEAATDALISLHRIDVSEGEVATLGRPAGYLERQVDTFSRLWPVNTRRDIPAVGSLASWLGTHIPVSRRFSVVHGDYRLGNLMFGRATPPRVAAILDWEMATLGDPLADLGYLTATYAETRSPWTPMELTSVTREPGYLRRDEIVERYQRELPFEESLLRWYQALALWKAAIFCEALYTRSLDGEEPDDAFLPRLEAGVPLLLDQAAEFAGIRVT